MKYFENTSSVEIVKKTYRKLAMKYHPDRKGGSEEIFKLINNEYEDAIAQALLTEKMTNSKKKTKIEDILNDKFREVINTLINVENIEIEIIGDFIWVSGKTYPIKETLKQFGFLWASSKKKWYLPSKGWKPTKRRTTKTMSEIRNIYGSTKIKSEKEKQVLIEG